MKGKQKPEFHDQEIDNLNASSPCSQSGFVCVKYIQECLVPGAQVPHHASPIMNHDLTSFYRITNLGSTIYQSGRSHLTVSIYIGSTKPPAISPRCHNHHRPLAIAQESEER
jgi:hypothetical protein